MVRPPERLDLDGDPGPGHGEPAGLHAHEARRLLRDARGHLAQPVGPGAVHAPRPGEWQSRIAGIDPPREDADHAPAGVRAHVMRWMRGTGQRMSSALVNRSSVSVSMPASGDVVEPIERNPSPN